MKAYDQAQANCYMSPPFACQDSTFEKVEKSSSRRDATFPDFRDFPAPLFPSAPGFRAESAIIPAAGFALRPPFLFEIFRRRTELGRALRIDFGVNRRFRLNRLEHHVRKRRNKTRRTIKPAHDDKILDSKAGSQRPRLQIDLI